MRLFFSLPLPAEARERLRGPLERARAVCGRSLSFANPAQLHFTLAFLGEQDEAALERAREAASRVKQPTFDVDIARAGAFPSLSRPRVVWLGLRQGAPELSNLAGALREELAHNRVSFDDKPFRPHLTIARLKSRGRVPGEALTLFETCAATAHASEFHLVHSEGGRHETLHSFPLEPHAM
ncbi:MAG TPA: RNA 2',3'-cyclic phosphodiesterase [Myxococcales bacterium]|jgi:2'-5' RNA ligase